MKRLLPILSSCMILPALTSSALELSPIGTWKTGLFDKSAAEIAQYDKDSQRLFVVNSALPGIDVVDISDPSNPSKEFSITVESFGSGVQSVAIHDGLIALAVSGDPSTEPGWIAFFNSEFGFLEKVEVGALPDMVTFTPDGSYVLSANEGEPSDDYTIDPAGSISLIEIPENPEAGFPEAITLTFEAFDELEIEGIHAGNPDSSLSQNLEPEYIAISPDGTIAMVSLQENNAVAIIDLGHQSIRSIVGLGYQDRREVAFDASDKDKKINIQNWPVFGLYQPDSITAFEVDGNLYFATANEGDARDYDGWSEEVRLEDLELDSEIFPNAKELQKKENLGRLKVTNAMGDTDGDGKFEEIYNFGGRSFSILDQDGVMIYDSGSLFEEKVAQAIPENFNSNNDENDTFDKRSDDKGPEPEAIAFAEINGTPILFVGLERVGGIMAFDVSDPTAPAFLTYKNNRNFNGIAENGTAGDLGPEGIIVIKAEDSPTKTDLLVVSNEVSGTVTIYEIK
tara:strand:- start:107 stop:1639 length:1533 start_codon:yes stop_codon:yes gene_type:complete